jgi:glycosyltransferase involved in cell wall biosynthesis
MYHLSHSPLISSFEKKKTCVVPFGLHPANYPVSKALTLESNRLKEKYGKFCLFVGRLVKYKGVRILIEAMKEVSERSPDLNLVIVGNGPLLRALQKQCDTLGLSERVYFDPAVSDGISLQAHFHACEFSILPSISRAEAFGMTLLEAMVFSKPLITTRLMTGVQEVNEEGVTGLLVEPSNTQALAEAILKLAQSPDLIKQYGQAARNRFLEYYTLDKMVTAHLSVYRSDSLS